MNAIIAIIIIIIIIIMSVIIIDNNNNNTIIIIIIIVYIYIYIYILLCHAILYYIILYGRHCPLPAHERRSGGRRARTNKHRVELSRLICLISNQGTTL